MKQLTKILFSTVAVFSTSLAFAEPVVDVDTMDEAPVLTADAIIGFKAAGTGCKDGQADIGVQDGEIVLSSNVVVEDNRAFCQYIVDLEVPAGWSVAVASAYGIGFLEGEASASLSAYIQGDLGNSATAEVSNSYYDVEMSDLVYTRCGAKRALNLKHTISAREGYGDFIDLMYLRLDWKRCY